MGCYASKQVQLVIAEESLMQEARNLVLEPPIRKPKSIASIMESSSKMSPRQKQDEEKSNSLAEPEEEDITSPSEEVVDNDLPIIKDVATPTDNAVATPNIQELHITVASTEEEEELPSWTKAACCGRSCQVSNSRFCCEHDFGRPVEHYCKPCRERYEEWREANDAFEELVHEMENRLKSSGKTLLESDSSNQGENSWGEHPIDDDLPLDICCTQDGSDFERSPQQERDNVLPCGHLPPPGHEYMLDPCPECRPQRGLWDGSTDSSPQSVRYKTRYSPMKIDLANLRRSAQLQQALLCEPKTSAAAGWSPEKRRLMYLTQPSKVSSLSLEDSSTGSMRSF